MGYMLTKKDVFEFLEAAGIGHGDKVAIHCSLKSIGEIEGGADGLIDAFCEYLSDGLFIVPTHTWDNVDGEHPYDVRVTEPCIGVLAKVAAFRKDGVRSLHPTHSVAVFGKRAAEYVKGEEKSASPAPVGGALSRLYEERGKILLVGVGHERNTYLHAVDERLGISDRLSEDGYVMTIIDWNGNEMKSPLFHGHFTKACDTCVNEYYPNYTKAFEHFGAVTYSTLGNAKVYVCDARKMTDVAKMLWDNADHDLCVREETIAF